MGDLGTGARRAEPVCLWVVEDSPLARRHIQLVLGPLYEVECFVDGETMLERFTNEQPDVLLTDWELPGISGLDIVRFVCERSDEISLPVLLMTASGPRNNFTEPLEAGANDFLAKPYDDAELLARVATLVRVHMLARRVRVAAEFEQQLIGIVSHDLKNPITSIVLGAQALIQRAGGDDSAAAIAARIQSSGQRGPRARPQRRHRR